MKLTVLAEKQYREPGLGSLASYHSLEWINKVWDPKDTTSGARLSVECLSPLQILNPMCMVAGIQLAARRVVLVYEWDAHF